MAPPARIPCAQVMVALGELRDAERELEPVLEVDPENHDAISLLAKIRHIQGELSEAVACWAHAHARSPYKSMVRMHLVSMLNLVRDPERGAGEFLAVGNFQLVRKPMAFLELEEAFRLLANRKPHEARAYCQVVARKHKDHDRALYKTAVMADAWCAELSGDLEGACRVLEGLGRQRGFESDLDRLQPLLDLYERLGDPDRLNAAVNICRFLQHTYPDIPVFGRLAALHRRLGNDELAERHQARFVEAFDQRMHRPSFARVVAVAARRYFPLARLRSLASEPQSLPDDATDLEQRLAAALIGPETRTFASVTEDAPLLERKYAADEAWAAQDDDRAASFYTSVLRDDPRDLQLIRALLAHSERPAWLGAVLGEPGVSETLERFFGDGGLSADPRDPRLWRAHATLLELTGHDDERLARSRERAQALEEAARERAHPIGRVLAAAVYHFVGQAKGLIHEVWAGRENSETAGGTLPRNNVLGNLTEDMRTAVRNTFLAVREYARATFPHLTGDILDYEYSFKITKDDEPSGGTSAGLPTALAFLSVFLQRPVPQDMAFSGVVVADAHDVLRLRPVGDAEYKVKGAYHRNLRALVLPVDNRQGLADSHMVPAKVQAAVCRYAARFDEAVSLAFGEDLFR